MIFVFAMTFQLLIQFIHSFAVLCTVARAVRGCLPGAGIPTLLASQCSEIDVDKINNLLYWECVQNAFSLFPDFRAYGG